MSERDRERWRWRATLALVAIAAALPFLHTLSGGFVYDDRFQIVENDQLRHLRNLPRFFLSDVWAAVGIPYSSYYRPLMYTTFALEFALAGPAPWLYRTTNLLLHVACTVLVAGLLRRTGASLLAAGLAGLFFAVHPMHAEVVAWPSARPELLVTLFTLAAGWVYAGSDPAEGPTRERFLGVGALVLLALFSKETGVLAPVLIGLVAMLRAPAVRATGRIHAGISASLPFVALIAIFLGVRGLVIRVSSLPVFWGEDPKGILPRTAPEAALRLAAITGDYLRSLLWPVGGSSFRVPSLANVRGGLVWLPLGVVSLLAAPVSAAAAWLAFAFLALGLQSPGILAAGYLAQRYAYLPSVGACAAVALVVATFGLERGGAWRRAATAGVVAFALAACVALAIPRAREWTAEPLLWTAARARDPESPAVLANYAYLLVDQGRAAEAIPLFERLDQLDPEGWAAPNGLANANAALGRPREAIPYFEEAIRRAPKIPQLRQSLGFVYEDLGDYESARRVFQEAAALFPDSAVGIGTLSVIEAESGDPVKALAETEAALAHRPDLGRLRMNRIALLARVGRIDDAIRASEELAADPVLGSEGERSLGILYDSYRHDSSRALAHYERALTLDPRREDAEQLRRRIAVLRRQSERLPTMP